MWKLLKDKEMFVRKWIWFKEVLHTADRESICWSEFLGSPPDLTHFSRYLSNSAEIRIYIQCWLFISINDLIAKIRKYTEILDFYGNTYLPPREQLRTAVAPHGMLYSSWLMRISRFLGSSCPSSLPSS